MTNPVPPERHPGSPLAWGLLLLLGQAATLAMMEAGNLVGYQHYPAPWLLPSRAPGWAIVLFAIEALAVAVAVVRHRLAIRTAIAGAPRVGLLLVAAAFVLTSATLSRDPAVFASELVFASVVQLVHLGAVVLLALALQPRHLARLGDWSHRWLGDPTSGDAVQPAGPDRFVWTLAAFVAIIAALLALLSYQRHPHVPDEVVYLIHARYLAAGQLAMPLPPVPEAFNVDLMTYQATRWFSPVPPGWPMILAVGAFLGVPWLVNPVLGGINILLAHTVLREIYPARTARLATLLLAVSPWHLFMAMNLMTHTATLTAALLAAACVARLRRDPRWRWAVVGGIGIGIVALIRPLEGFVLALLLGFWSLGARGRRWRLAPSAVLTVATIATGALVLPYNAHLTGSARTFPIMAYTDAAYGPGTNALGFGANRGLGWPGLDPLPGHGPADVLINANFNLYQTNVELLGWATGSLLPILLLLLLGRLRRSDWQMLVVIGAVTGVHAFYYFSGGPDFGARYWYLILVPCVVLVARGLETLGSHDAAAGRRVDAGTLALVMLTLLLFVPWRATDKYHHYRKMRPDARRLATDPAMRNGVVLVRGDRHPDYASAVVYNPLDTEGDAPLFAWDRGAEVRRALAEAFPDRHFWMVDGPTRSGDGYVVVAGPLTGAELAARPDTLAVRP